MAIQHALTELSQMLGDRLTRSKSDLVLQGQTETLFPRTSPATVAYPETTEEVRAIVSICAKARCPLITPRPDPGTQGPAPAQEGAVTLDFSRMARILAINAEDMTAVVQPGLTREALNVELRDTGHFFPVDAPANTPLGAMAATRAMGTASVRYGTMRENVMGLCAVMGDGRVIRTGTQTKQPAPGYDLTSLMVGAEGTLGIITELTLKLTLQPETITTATCAFPDLRAAIETAQATLQLGLPVARMEFVDAISIAAINSYSGAGMPLLPHLWVEFHGAPDSVDEHASRFADLVSDMGGRGHQWAGEAEDRSALWAMRQSAQQAILASREETEALVIDVSVPISQLADAVEATRADIASARAPGAIIGHVGDGNFRVILLINPNKVDDNKTAQSLSDRLTQRALFMGGCVTGAPGGAPGHGKQTEAWALMGDIKSSLDPQNVLNPGILFPQKDEQP